MAMTKKAKSDYCPGVSCFTSIDVPKILVNCNLRHKFDGRSILPSRNSKAYYAAMTQMIQESTSLEHAKVYKVAKKSKPKPPQGGAEDGPGEHADVLLEKPTKADKEIENVFGDCGDDVSTIADSEAYSFFDSDNDPSEDDTMCFDDEFYAWACPGSEVKPDNPILKRPLSRHFPSMSSAYAAVRYDSRYAGQHDLMELFAGEAGTTRLCLRRGLKCGPAFDLAINIDLTLPSDVNLLWQYMLKHRPKIVIAGPPCTAFSSWQHINRLKDPEGYARKLRIGTQLANLTASICQFQIQHGRHFVIENPLSSGLWELPSLVALRGMPGVSEITLDQCMVGLADPDGLLTRKSTRLLASCHSLVRRLAIRCTRDHPHVQLAGSKRGILRTRHAQVWPRRMLELLTEGILETLKSPVSAYPARPSSY